MFSVFGINLPGNKNIFSFLLKIYGIGKSRALIICNKININFEKKIVNLNSIDKKNILKELKNYLIDNDLKIKKKNVINNLISIRCYRGTRHRKGLPCRGQRTRTNAKTVKLLKKNEKIYKKF